MEDVSELLAQLVAIDSVNPDLVSGGAGEGEIAGFVAGWLERAGLEVELDEVAPGRPNVIAVKRGSGGGRSLMLNAHMDTVGVEGMEHPFEPEILDGRLYGRGAYDMKASLAAIMAAAAEAGPLSGDLILTAVADEEYASMGTDGVVARMRADAAIVTEPTALDLGVAHKGFVWLEIETKGRAAHGSRSDLGVDAIAKMGSVLVELEAIDRSLHADPTHPLLGSGSLHASLIRGGQELSSYPEHCVVGIERRTIPGETAAFVVREITESVERCHASDPALTASVRPLFARGPFEVGEDETVVQLVRRHAAAVRGTEPAAIGMFGWQDSAILSDAGIPTVVFGPGGEGAHAVVEWSDLAETAQCAEILRAVAEDFCG